MKSTTEKDITTSIITPTEVENTDSDNKTQTNKTFPETTTTLNGIYSFIFLKIITKICFTFNVLPI